VSAVVAVSPGRETVEAPGQNGGPGSDDRLRRYLELDRANEPYLRWQLEQFSGCFGRRILEVGIGVGGILNLIGERELVFGIDLDPEMVAYSRLRFADRPGYQFAVADLGALPDETLRLLQGQRLDSVICINVLEHVRDDLVALPTMEQVLAPGGALALLVPAQAALYGPYDRLDGHWRRYSRRQLRRLLSHTDLRVERLRHFNMAGALGWWMQYKLLRRTHHGNLQFSLMNRLIPLLRALERVVPPPFGLSLVAVCRKPGNPATQP
jgi:SAM-dependent methyltransferase